MDKQTPALTQPPPSDRNGPLSGDSASDATPDQVAATAALDAPESGATNEKSEPDAGPASDAGGGEGAKPPAGEPPRSGNGGARAALVLSILALIGVGVVGWQLFESHRSAEQLRQEVAGRLSTADSRVTELRALSRQAQESNTTLQGRFGALESKVAASEGQTAALESLYQEFSRSRVDRVLAEVAQAVTIAAQQLRLAGNYEAALIALQAAESRLAAPELGHLHDLRRALMKDIDTVKSHPQVDVSGLALKLELLFSHIDRLPLAYTVEPVGTPPAMDEVPPLTEPVAEDERWWRNALGFARSLGSDAWNEVRKMIRLERMDQNDAALLSPSQSVYLRENVKIRLLTARLALLGSDARTYSADLGMAKEGLTRYFDTRDTQVQHVINEIDALAAADMRAETPTLTDTFSALAMVQSRASNGAADGAEAKAIPAEPSNPEPASGSAAPPAAETR